MPGPFLLGGLGLEPDMLPDRDWTEPTLGNGLIRLQPEGNRAEDHANRVATGQP